MKRSAQPRVTQPRDPGAGRQLTELRRGRGAGLHGKHARDRANQRRQAIQRDRDS